MSRTTRSRRFSPKRLMLYVLLIAAVWVLYSYGLAAYSWRRPTLGVIDGQLQPCGAKPNCVCSCYAGDAAIESLPIASEEPRTAFDRARKCVESLPRTALVEAAPGYARYECSSALFRYTDDVELLLDESAGEIHIRSASRVGYSDLGVNRKRVTAIRQCCGRAAEQTDEPKSSARSADSHN